MNSVCHECYLPSSGQICSLNHACDSNAPSLNDAATGKGGIHSVDDGDDGGAINEIHGFGIWIGDGGIHACGAVVWKDGRLELAGAVGGEGGIHTCEWVAWEDEGVGGCVTIGGDGGIHSCNGVVVDMSLWHNGDGGLHLCDGGDDDAGDGSLLDRSCLSSSMDIASNSFTMSAGRIKMVRPTGSDGTEAGRSHSLLGLPRDVGEGGIQSIVDSMCSLSVEGGRIQTGRAGIAVNDYKSGLVEKNRNSLLIFHRLALENLMALGGIQMVKMHIVKMAIIVHTCHITVASMFGYAISRTPTI